MYHIDQTLIFKFINKTSSTRFQHRVQRRSARLIRLQRRTSKYFPIFLLRHLEASDLKINFVLSDSGCIFSAYFAQSCLVLQRLRALIVRYWEGVLTDEPNEAQPHDGKTIPVYWSCTQDNASRWPDEGWVVGSFMMVEKNEGGSTQTPLLIWPVSKLVYPLSGTRKHVGKQLPLKGCWLDP